MALEAVMAVQTGVGVYALQGCYWDSEVGDRIRSVYSPSPLALQAYAAGLALFLLISLILLLSNTPLLLFHLYLSLHGITTYEYILQNRQKNPVIQPKPGQVSNRMEGTGMNDTTLSKSTHYLMGEDSLESAKKRTWKNQATFAGQS